MRCRPATSKDHDERGRLNQIPQHDSSVAQAASSLENDDPSCLHIHGASSNDHAEIHIHVDDDGAEEGEKLLSSNPRQSSLTPITGKHLEVSAGPLLGDVWLEKLRKRLQTADLRAGIPV